MYRGFKQESKTIQQTNKNKLSFNEQECPNGEVNEDTFKEIFEKFFPYGSEFLLHVLPRIMKMGHIEIILDFFCFLFGILYLRVELSCSFS